MPNTIKNILHKEYYNHRDNHKNKKVIISFDKADSQLDPRKKKPQSFTFCATYKQ